MIKRNGSCLVEVFFGIVTRRAIRCDSYASIRQIVAAIRAAIDGWNEPANPFAWTETAEEMRLG